MPLCEISLGGWPNSLEIHCSSFEVYTTMPVNITYSIDGTLLASGIIKCTICFKICRKGTGMFWGMQECLCGENCAYSARHLPASKILIWNFYRTWLTVDSVRVECRVMMLAGGEDLCYVLWSLTSFGVVGGRRSVRTTYYVLEGGGCFFLRNVPTSPSDYMVLKQRPQTRMVCRNCTSVIIFIFIACLSIQSDYHMGEFSFDIVHCVGKKFKKNLTLLRFSRWLMLPVLSEMHRAVHQESVNHRGHNAFLLLNNEDRLHRRNVVDR
jgi:hypothetical protein